jgi:integrase
VLHNRPTHRLLFPAEDGRMRTDIRKLLDRLGERAGWKRGEIRSKMFRHTYCAARLQTLDHGAPVGVYTVARELGHGSTAMAEQVYAHLGTIRHRSEAVEYRVEQHAEALAERLQALAA